MMCVCSYVCIIQYDVCMYGVCCVDTIVLAIICVGCILYMYASYIASECYCKFIIYVQILSKSFDKIASVPSL